MPIPKRTECRIPLERLFLNLENPRHEPLDDETGVIESLCGDEQVRQLAADIAEFGLNPLDRFGVMRDQDGNDNAFTMAEGNRRVCALKLLADPDLAPAELVDYFEGLARKWTPIEEVPCVIFEDIEDRNVWLERRHLGAAGGKGQKAWDSVQQARLSGASSRNRVALAFLDYAEGASLITAEDRKGKLTTVQRFLGNPEMQATFGLVASDPERLSRTRTEDDFAILAQQFIADLVAKDPRVNSRKNKADVETYARELNTLEGLSDERVDPEPLVSDPQKPKRKRKTRPIRPRRRSTIPWNSDIRDALQDLGNWKLQSLYYSICSVPLREHTPLVSVGVWSFFESLTASAGRRDSISFLDFLDNNRLVNRYQIGTKRQVKPLRDAVGRILHYGNTTKHHDTSATFDRDQLANDMESLGGLLIKVIEDAIAQNK